MRNIVTGGAFLHDRELRDDFLAPVTTGER